MTPKLAGAIVTGGLVLLATFAGFIAVSYGVFDDDGRVDAGFLPVVVAVTIVLSGLVDLVARLKAPEEAKGPDFEEVPDMFGRNQKQRNRQFIQVVAMLIVTLVLIDVIGFIYSFGALVFAISFLVERKKILSTLAISLASMFIAWLIFDQFLQVPLPTGIFGQ